MFEIVYQDEEELAVWGTYPLMSQAVKLLDGTGVTVRPVQPDDALRLQAFFARLSQESIYLRFLQYRRELPYQEAMRLVAVDYRAGMALVAARGEDIIALAHYEVIRSDEANWAEPAIVVEDRYQGRGLGTLLLKWLAAHARSHGIRAFRATVHPINAQILRFVEHSRLPVEREFRAGVWDITIGLEPESAQTLATHRRSLGARVWNERAL